MKIEKIALLVIVITSCAQGQENKKNRQTTDQYADTDYLIQVLDTIRIKEQVPISKRDSLMEVYGVDSKEADIHQKIFRSNHTANIRKIKNILDHHGWPDRKVIGDQGSRTICNVLQHADQATREAYIPLMKRAVLDQKLEARYLVRAEDRIATNKGELQRYGGQMKYYPETKSFNVWPVYDPANIDKRRAEIGLGPIADHLKDRFNFEWDLEEQVKRTAAFEKERNSLK